MRFRTALLTAFFAAFVATSSANAAKCVRLSLSDIVLNKPALSAAARERLMAAAVENLKEKGWSGKGKLKIRREKTSCESYLNLGNVDIAFRCRIAATYCTKGRKTAPVSAIGRVVKLRLKGSKFEISGVLEKFDRVKYVIVPPGSDAVTVPASRFDCVGKICPKAAK